MIKEELNLKHKPIIKIWTYILTVVVLIVSYPVLRNSNWQGNTQLHTIMETVATFLSLTIGVIALIRFYSKKNNTFLFIGSGFLGAAFLDGYHAIVTSTYFSESFPSAPSYLIPWSWISSRLFLSQLMLVSYYAWKREEKFGEKGKIFEGYVYLLVGILTIISFLFFVFVPLPRAYYPELFFGRPEEFLPAIFFLFALIGYLRKGKWQYNDFEHWLVLSLIVGVISQAIFMSFSNELFDYEFDAAHLLKKVSYLCVLIGLFISMFKLFSETEKQKINLQKEIIEKEVYSKKLQESQSLLNSFLDNSPSVIYIKDVNSKYILVNSFFEKLFNVKNEEVFGLTDFEIFPKEMAAAFQENDAKVIEQNEEITLEEIAMHEDGNHTYISQKFPVYDKDGKIYAVAGISTDITERKIAEESLFEYSRQLESRNKELQEFAYIASHDLREPLRKVQSFGERLKDKCGETLGEKGNDYLERMQNATSRMQTLIDDLLNYSRITTQRKSFDNISLENVARGVVSDLSVSILESRTTIILSSLPSISADKTQMQQLFQNLIGNAIKFAQPNTLPEIKIYSENITNDEDFFNKNNTNEEWVKVVIEDNGIGIDMNYSEKIFGVFERLHGRSEYEGTGIGLSIVKKIVERHNGKIILKSEPNIGSKFEIFLPIKNKIGVE